MTLTSDMSPYGSVYIKGGTIDLNGHTLKNIIYSPNRPYFMNKINRTLRKINVNTERYLNHLAAAKSDGRFCVQHR